MIWSWAISRLIVEFSWRIYNNALRSLSEIGDGDGVLYSWNWWIISSLIVKQTSVFPFSCPHSYSAWSYNWQRLQIDFQYNQKMKNFDQNQYGINLETWLGWIQQRLADFCFWPWFIVISRYFSIQIKLSKGSTDALKVLDWSEFDHKISWMFLHLKESQIPELFHFILDH